MTDRYIVVVGCGRLGSLLANRLSGDGNALVVIDRDPATFDDLSLEYSGFRVEGDATRLSVLNQAKVGSADVLIATTHQDNVNLMVAQVARRIFGVGTVLARVFDPKREEVYSRLGIDTVSPISLAAERFLTSIDSGGIATNGASQ
jgi:trk system potassium uptake protein TrkA